MASPLVDPLASARLEAALVKTYRERGAGLVPAAVRQELAGGNGPPAATQVAARWETAHLHFCDILLL